MELSNVVLCLGEKDDIENTDANGLKRFPEISSSHGIPSKRIRDVVSSGSDVVSFVIVKLIYRVHCQYLICGVF